MRWENWMSVRGWMRTHRHRPRRRHRGVPAPQESPAPAAPPVPKDVGHYDLGGGWGNAINFQHYPDRVVGWKGHRPRPGDYLLGRMRSGNIGVFRFDSVQGVGTPRDMFFASVTALGYAGEVEIPPATRIASALSRELGLDATAGSRML